MTEEEQKYYEMGKALENAKVQCGECSNAFILLEVSPNWDWGYWVCESCSSKD